MGFFNGNLNSDVDGDGYNLQFNVETTSTMNEYLHKSTLFTKEMFKTLSSNWRLKRFFF